MTIAWPNCVRPIMTEDLRRGEVTVGYQFEGEAKLKRHDDERRPKSLARPHAVPQPVNPAPQPKPAIQLAFAL